jgi:hypothetical protein
MAKTRVNRHNRKPHKAGTKKSYGKCENPVSTYGFQKWYTAMFEQLGLIVLGKAKGDMPDKIDSYKKSLKRLIHKLECKIDNVEERDRKIDLQIMCQNVKILSDHTHKYL